MTTSMGSAKTPDPVQVFAEPDAAGDAVTPSEPGLILLIEDDFMLRGSLATLLDAEGYKVVSAANALDALQRLDRPPKPSLILLDIMLPYMDGLEFRAVQRRMRNIADIPVIVITAVGIRAEVADELELESAFFKPLDREKLLAAIKRVCSPSVS